MGKTIFAKLLMAVILLMLLPTPPAAASPILIGTDAQGDVHIAIDLAVALADFSVHDLFTNGLDTALASANPPVAGVLGDLEGGIGDRWNVTFRNTSTESWTDFHIRIQSRAGAGRPGIPTGGCEGTARNGAHWGTNPDPTATVFGSVTVTDGCREVSMSEGTVLPGGSFAFSGFVAPGTFSGTYLLRVQATNCRHPAQDLSQQDDASCPAPVPEPASWVLLGSGLLSACGRAVLRKTADVTRRVRRRPVSGTPAL